MLHTQFPIKESSELTLMFQNFVKISSICSLEYQDTYFLAKGLERILFCHVYISSSLGVSSPHGWQLVYNFHYLKT